MTDPTTLSVFTCWPTVGYSDSGSLFDFPLDDSSNFNGGYTTLQNGSQVHTGQYKFSGYGEPQPSFFAKPGAVFQTQLTCRCQHYIIYLCNDDPLLSFQSGSYMTFAFSYFRTGAPPSPPPPPTPPPPPPLPPPPAILFAPAVDSGLVVNGACCRATALRPSFPDPAALQKEQNSRTAFCFRSGPRSSTIRPPTS